MGNVQMLFLLERRSGRRLRLEVPTVFGRHRCFFTYPEEAQPRFSADDARRLMKLDFVEISGDESVSRTHGVLDPTGPVVRDLNSKNGIAVGSQRVATTPGREGPAHLLRNGDVVKVGGLRFVVELESAGQNSLCDWLARDRRAFVVPGDSPEAAQVEAFLRERKRFRAGLKRDWGDLAAELASLGHGTSTQLGLIVIGLVARPEGDRLHVGGGSFSVADLVNVTAHVPASKVIALQAEGDPTRVEEAFKDCAFQDMVLVTSTVPTHSGVIAPLENESMSALPPVRERRAHAAYHSVLDGLDGLIRPDSNVLDLEWLRTYEGALHVVVGTRLQPSDRELELSYRLPDPTDGTEGSFRVRHHFDSSSPPSLTRPTRPTWRDEPGTI